MSFSAGKTASPAKPRHLQPKRVLPRVGRSQNLRRMPNPAPRVTGSQVPIAVRDIVFGVVVLGAVLTLRERRG